MAARLFSTFTTSDSSHDASLWGKIDDKQCIFIKKRKVSYNEVFVSKFDEGDMDPVGLSD